VFFSPREETPPFREMKIFSEQLQSVVTTSSKGVSSASARDMHVKCEGVCRAGK
jgi:hypothetical protein